jgi:predicted porin
MRTIINLTLATSFLALSMTSSSAFANAGPQVANGCDELSARIKKLEDRAVMSDTKKIILSGFVNRAALWLNNGENSNTAHVDNDNEASRLNFTGTADFNEDLRFGGTFETSFTPNSSANNDVHQAQTNAMSEDNFHVRIAELFMDSHKFGKLSLGRGSMASDYTMSETDLSGTRVVATGSNIWEIAGGASFWNNTTRTNGQVFVKNPTDSTVNAAGRTVAAGNSAFVNMDGLVRHDRARYDTPRFYGVSLSTSHGYQNSGDLFDVAARFAGKFMGIKVAADLAYENDQQYSNYEYQQFNGSIGVLFPISISKRDDTGFNLYFGGAHREWEARGQRDGNFYHGKVGYVDQYFNIGHTALAVDYANAKNMARANDDTFVDGAFNTQVSQTAKSWGVFLVQNVDVVASQLYAGYRRFSLDRTNSTANFEEIDAVMVGARVKL